MDTFKYNIVQKDILQKMTANLIKDSSQIGYKPTIYALLQSHDYIEKLNCIEERLVDTKKPISSDTLSKDLSTHVCSADNTTGREKSITRSTSKN